MVIKICKICGKEFDAKGATKCCSDECKKINRLNNKKKYNQSEKGKAARKKDNKKYYENHRDRILEQKKEYRENHRDEISERNKEYYENNRDDILKKQKEYRDNHRDEISEYQKEYQKEYYKDNRDEILKKTCIRQQDRVSELCEQYDGDIEAIKKYCPTTWLLRELEMLIYYNVSYFDGMIAKIKSTPVCEVTGSDKNLVIHHLKSYNTHPELGADPNNMVRITNDIHNEFHNIYGRGNNTREQWFEFLEKNRNIYI